MGLHSRYQRYELMSPIPVAILIRTIREKFLLEEVKLLEKIYQGCCYNQAVKPNGRFEK